MLGPRAPHKGAAARPKKAWQLEQEGVLAPPRNAAAAPARSPPGAAGGRRSRSRSRSRNRHRGRSSSSSSSSSSRRRRRSKSRSRSRSREPVGSTPRAAATTSAAAPSPAALLAALLLDIGAAEARALQLEALADAASGGAQVCSPHTRLCAAQPGIARRRAELCAASRGRRRCFTRRRSSRCAAPTRCWRWTSCKTRRSAARRVRCSGLMSVPQWTACEALPPPWRA